MLIQHAENHGERNLELQKWDASTYMKKMDGYREYRDPLTLNTMNVVYKYYDCFYHLFLYCYDSEEAHPLKCDPYDLDADKVMHCEVYATTRKIQEDSLWSV